MPESVLKLFDKRVLCHGQKRFLTILLAVLLHADSAGPILSILSDDELPHPSTLLLDTSFTVPLPPRTQLYHRSCSNKHTHDTTIPWPVKRSRGFTGEYVKPTTTSSRNAAPLTTRETEKSALTDVTLSPGARVTYGSHPRAAGTHDGDSPTDASAGHQDRTTHDAMLHSALWCCASGLDRIQHSVHSKSLALKCTDHSVLSK